MTLNTIFSDEILLHISSFANSSAQVQLANTCQTLRGLILGETLREIELSNAGAAFRKGDLVIIHKILWQTELKFGDFTEFLNTAILAGQRDAVKMILARLRVEEPTSGLGFIYRQTMSFISARNTTVYDNKLGNYEILLPVLMENFKIAKQRITFTIVHPHDINWILANTCSMTFLTWFVQRLDDAEINRLLSFEPVYVADYELYAQNHDFLKNYSDMRSGKKIELVEEIFSNVQILDPNF